MQFLRSPLGRAARALCLLGLLGLSILFIKNIVTADWRNDQEEMAQYQRSPGCFPHQETTQVDPSLPPCRNEAMTVSAKSQNTTVDHRRSGDYTRVRRFFTLQSAAGPPQTVGDIYEDLWNSVRAGDQVSVTSWRDKVREVSANGYSESINDPQEWDRLSIRLLPWVCLGLLCSALLSLQWHLYRRSSLLSLNDF